ETQITTSTPTQTQAQGINFKEYKRGEIIRNWWKLFDTSVVYVSKGYEDLAKHYFPNAQIKPASEFENGIAILSPKDARELLRGKPMLITINDYFGYVLYKVGYKFVGQDIGMIVAYKEDNRDRL
ncbi:phosphoesterase, partial [Thermococcus sp. LS1]|nr:phosphoesterase [Thermococcus sp. LS1]